MTRIFISYRRSDSEMASGRIYDHLSRHFGEDNVFLDVNAIDLGEDFVNQLQQAVGSCQILLAVIGSQWLTVTDKAGQRRLDDPNDFVRIEIRTALERGIRVIPILIGDTRMPTADDLPSDLKALARRQAHRVTNERFRDDITKLCQAVERAIEQSASQTQTAGEAPADAPRPRLQQPIAIEIAGGEASPILNAGIALPAEFAQVFSTAEDSQRQIEVHLVYGNKSKAAENVSLGKFLYTGIPPAPRGVPQIEINVRVDEAYRLTVSAVDLAQDKRTLLGTVDLPKPDKPQSRLTNDDFAEIFEELFGEKARKSRGRDIEMPLTITAQQAQKGDLVRVQVRRTAACSRCDGSGAAAHASWSTCARCGGKGRVQEAKQTLLGSRPGMTTCPTCRGKGKVPSALCSACNGTGIADAETTLEVKVPAGIKAGQRLRLKGQGDIATNGGTPGDLYLVIQVKG